MSFTDLVSLFFERSNAMQTFWNFYITVTLALLAFFGSLRQSSRKTTLALVLSISFAAFAVVNCMALWDVTNTRMAIKQMVIHAECERPPSAETLRQVGRMLNPSPPWAVVGFHVVGDIFTVGCIWYLALRKL